MPASTVHRVPVRHGMNRLAWIDRPIGRVIRRIETSRPGELVHIDVKKLARVPDGGGHKIHGRAGTRNGSMSKHGSGYTTSTPRSMPTVDSPTPSSPAARTPSTVSLASIGPSTGSTNRASRSIGSSPTTATATGPSPGETAAQRSNQAHSHQALPTRDERQGRTLQSNPARRMGLRPTLAIRTITRPRP